MTGEHGSKAETLLGHWQRLCDQHNSSSSVLGISDRDGSVPVGVAVSIYQPSGEIF